MQIGTLDLSKAPILCSRSCNNHNVIAFFQAIFVEPVALSYQSDDPMSDHTVSNFFTDRDSDSTVR